MCALSWWLTYYQVFDLSFQNIIRNVSRYFHGTDVCTRYGVGVSWQRKSLGDMDVIWTELKGCACKTTEECQRSKRCALKATTAAAAVRQCVGLNSAAKEKCFRSDLIHCYHPRLVFTHTQVDRTLLHDANANNMRGPQKILYRASMYTKCLTKRD